MPINTNQMTLPDKPYSSVCNGYYKEATIRSNHSTLCEESPKFNPMLLKYTLYGIKYANCRECYSDYTRNVRKNRHSASCKRRSRCAKSNNMVISINVNNKTSLSSLSSISSSTSALSSQNDDYINFEDKK